MPKMKENANPADVINILIASDIHLGYNEKDPERGNDSFRTFEEILSLAVEREVDFVLLGGDLFHDSKPSQKCLCDTTALFRKYIMGDRPVEVEFLSDQSENFQHCVNPVVNYEDPNLNIAIPIFSIHGNHDDPTGVGRVSSLDLFSSSGFVNYFGKWMDLKQIAISPLLMRKGETKLALYGLSYIKDERLSRLFRDRKVQLYQPKEETDEWFNIMVLHQNRADRGINNCLPEDALPKFLNLVIWGHEHECRIRPEKNPIQGFSVIQPGSPVATSLCEGEAVPKHVGILKIHKKNFELEPIKLKTVRPFVMDTIVLSKIDNPFIGANVKEEVQAYLAEHVHYMLEKAKEQLSGDVKQPLLPLIRLRVEYSVEEEYFNALKFGHQFSTQVANPRDIILLKKERIKQGNKDAAELDLDMFNDILEKAKEVEKVETVVERYFTDVNKEIGLKVLSVKGLNEAVTNFIEKADGDAITDLISHQLKKTTKYLIENLHDVDSIQEALDNYRAIRSASNVDEAKEAQLVFSNKSRVSRGASNEQAMNDILISSDEDDDDKLKASTSSMPAQVRGRGRGRGRGSRGGNQASGSANTSRASTTRGSRGGSRGKKQLEISQLLSNSSKKTRQRMDWSDSD